jgi:hypothetical protein
MILDRFMSTDNDDHYIERTADRLRAMTAGTSTYSETDPALIRERLRRPNRTAESRAHLSGSAA